MNNKQKIIDFYLKHINPDINKQKLIKTLTQTMSKVSFTKLETGLTNMANSNFWKPYKKHSPEFVLAPDRIKTYCNLTLNLGIEYLPEIRRVEKWFIFFYNLSLRCQYQEWFNYYPFITKKTNGDTIRKVACFIILHKLEMANTVKTNNLKKIVYIFTNTLFDIFVNEPPKLHQYLKNDDIFWNWFNETFENNYVQYDFHGVICEFEDELKEVKYTEQEKKDFYEQEQTNKRNYENETIPECIKEIYKNLKKR